MKPSNSTALPKWSIQGSSYQKMYFFNVYNHQQQWSIKPSNIPLVINILTVKKSQNQFVLSLPPPLEESPCSLFTYSLPWLSCHSPSVVDVFLMIGHIKTRQNVWITDIWCVGLLTAVLSSIPVWFVSVSSWRKLENITTLLQSLCPCNIFKKLSIFCPLLLPCCGGRICSVLCEFAPYKLPNGCLLK